MKILSKIVRYLKRKHYCSVYKKRCKKLNIEYKPGVIIGRNIQNWGVKVIIGHNSRIADNCVLWGDGLISIGNNSSIGENSWLYSSKNGGVEIGNDVNCAANLYLIDSDHSFKEKSLIRLQPLISKKIIISDDVWIAANVTIIKGTEIGSHSVVGACSLCNKKYANNSVIAGVPAKIIKSI